MPLTRADLLARLASLGLPVMTVDHAPLHTVEESRRLRGQIAGAHTKNLFLKCKKGRLWLVVALEDASIELKRLHERIGSGRLSFGSAELLQSVLGVLPGSVTPFALVNDAGRQVTAIFDAELMRHEKLNFHPLENTATTTIVRDDFVAFLKAIGHEPRVMAVSAEAQARAAGRPPP